jgi:thiamine biosynthesis protein ThiS
METEARNDAPEDHEWLRFLWDRTAVVKEGESRYRSLGTEMEAIINGERRPLRSGTTISDLLDELRLGGRRIAVEVNRDIIRAADYPGRVIADGDEVEIVQFVGGG